MTTELATTYLVELLSRLLARRTDPGHGHVILSEAEYDERLRQELEATLAPGDSIPEAVSEAALRVLRNRLVHFPITTPARADHAAATTLWATRICKALETSRESSHDQLRALLEASAPDRRRPQDSDIGLAVAAAVADSFLEQLIAPAELLGKLDNEEAARLGRRAAEQVLAGARWSQVVGDRLDTTQVGRLLGVTRQALAKRQTVGSLLGLAGDGTTWYPTWQFDLDDGHIRPEVRDLIGAFRDRLDDVDPLLIAAWATTPQDEDLAGDTPSYWLRTGRDPDQLRRAAERAAARLAR